MTKSGNPTEAATTPGGITIFASVRHQAVLLTLACLATSVFAGIQIYRTLSADARLRTRQERAAEVARDGLALLEARDQPHQVVAVDVPASDLLQAVQHAMQTGGLEARTLVSTIPQPPRRVAGTSVSEAGQRLIFENVSLEPFLRMCMALRERFPQLRINGLHLRAADVGRWNVDLSVAYWTAL